MTLFGAVVLLGFYFNKQEGLNKQVDWNFSSNLNKRGGKIWCCWSKKWPQITVNFFLKTISEHARLLET